MTEQVVWRLDPSTGSVVPFPDPLTQAEWYVDPVGGSDNNDGTSQTKAVQHLSAILFRWGVRPYINQPTTITLLGPIGPGDAWTGVEPIFGPTGSLNVTAPLIPGQTPTCQGVVPPNFAVGTLGTINVSGQTWSQGQYVLDVTSQSYFWIINDLGGGTAAISAVRKTPDGFPGSYGSVTEGDELQLCSLQTLSIADSQCYGSAGIVRGLVFSRLTILPPSFIIYITEGVFAECYFGNYDSNFQPNGLTTSCFGCFFPSQSGYAGFAGSTNFYGGVIAGAGALFGDQTALDGDVAILLRNHWEGGTIFINRAYFGQTNDVDGPFAQFFLNANSAYGTSRMWGPGGWDASQNTLCILGDAAVSVLLLTGPLIIDGVTPSAGYYWNGTTYVSEAITAAGIDLRGGYQSLTTPSRFYKAAY